MGTIAGHCPSGSNFVRTFGREFGPDRALDPAHEALIEEAIDGTSWPDSAGRELSLKSRLS